MYLCEREWFTAGYGEHERGSSPRMYLAGITGNTTKVREQTRYNEYAIGKSFYTAPTYLSRLSRLHAGEDETQAS